MCLRFTYAASFSLAQLPTDVIRDSWLPWLEYYRFQHCPDIITTMIYEYFSNLSLQWITWFLNIACFPFNPAPFHLLFVVTVLPLLWGVVFYLKATGECLSFWSAFYSLPLSSMYYLWKHLVITFLTVIVLQSLRYLGSKIEYNFIIFSNFPISSITIQKSDANVPKVRMLQTVYSPWNKETC